MGLKRIVKKFLSKKRSAKASLQFFKIGDHVAYHILAPDTIGNDINKIKFYFVDENGQLICRTNIPSLLHYEFTVKRSDCFLFALVVSENDIPFKVSIEVNGMPYQAQQFSEEMVAIEKIK